MPLNKVDQVIQSLREKDKTISFNNLTCWEFKEDKYSLYIFLIELKDQDELLKVHEELRDYIAIYFQSQILEKDIERWNIYQFFLIERKIDDLSKQIIEQDKFSTRKIIYDNLENKLSDEEIKSLINQELFDFKIEKREIDKNSIESFLKYKHSSVLNLIEDLGASNFNESVEKILTSLGDE